MEDQTQAVNDGDKHVDPESDINPVGHLRVLTQKDLEQTDYPLQEGMSVCVCVCVCVCL